jgi:hypothetical protein
MANERWIQQEIRVLASSGFWRWLGALFWHSLAAIVDEFCALIQSLGSN